MSAARRISTAARFLLRRMLAIAAACAILLVLFWVPTSQPFVTPSGAPSQSAQADPLALERHVRALSERFHPRSFDDKARLEAAADYMGFELAALGLAVESQPFEVAGQTFRNIVVRIADRSGSFAGERIVVGAHYDSHGFVGADSTPGADDNASGVAGVIELARLLRLRPLERPVELVAYCLEEPPHFATPDMGSAHHAAGLRDTGVAVRLMLSLEMIGYFSDAPGSQDYPLAPLKLFYPDRGDFIAVVGRYRDWEDTRLLKSAMLGTGKVESINAPLFLPGIDFSDHRSYWNAGFRALMITDTAFYRNREYHRRGDTADRLDYRRMAFVVSALEAGLRALP